MRTPQCAHAGLIAISRQNAYMHEQTTKELVYALRIGSTCIGVHTFDV